MPEDIFKGLNALKSLDLGYNQLSSLPTNTFEGLKKLTNLDVRENQLTQIPGNLPDSITILMLQNNPLVETAVTKGYLGKQELSARFGIFEMSDFR